MNIEHADAIEWLLSCPPADLILTDPPHLDTFESAQEHQRFVTRWLPKAMRALKPTGSLYHTCGCSTQELKTYLSAAIMIDHQPDAILVWPHPANYVQAREDNPLLPAPGHHFQLLYRRSQAPPMRWTGSTLVDLVKPDPLYPTIITAFTELGDLVVDPFCGRGEIPQAARKVKRRWLGCDINAESVRYCVEDLAL